MTQLTAFGPLVLGGLPVGCWSSPLSLTAGRLLAPVALWPEDCWQTPIKLPLAIGLLASRLLASGTFLTQSVLDMSEPLTEARRP